MKKPVKLCALLLSALAMFSLVACVQPAGTTPEEKLTKISLAEVTHSVFYAPQYVAINLGFFEEECLEVELSSGEGADKVMAAVLSGSVNIGFAGPEASIYVYNEGKADHSQVFAQLTQRDGSFLVGREPVENFSWELLRGSHLLPGRKGGVPYMTLEYVVKQNGLTPGKDVEFDDSIQFALMTGAFTSGTGDYVTVFEPTASLIEKEGKGYILASVGAQTDHIAYTGYFAAKSYLAENGDIVQRFVNAVYRGQQWVQEHSAKEIAAVLVDSFPDTGEELLTLAVQRYKDIGAYSTTPVIQKDAFEMLQTVMAEAGELSERAPFAEVVNNKFAEAAVAK